MRILWLIWRDFTHPSHGGATIYMREVSQRLVEKGHEVMIVTSSYPGARSSETIRGVKIRRVGADWNIGILGALMLFLRIVPRADVIIDEVNVFPFWTPVITRRRKLLLIHHLAGDVLERYDLSPLRRRGLSVLQKLVIWLYNGQTTITPSPATKNELLKLGYTPSRVVFCPNGLPEIAELPSSSRAKREKPQAIYLGRVVPQKGIEIVIRAFRGVIERIPDARLLICGQVESQYHQKLKRLIDDSELSECVGITGYVSSVEKARLLQESHVFVIHSAKEGWGIAAMESMYYGTPVIASDVPGLRELVNHGVTGWLVEWGNVAELSGRIVQVLKEAQVPTSDYREISDSCRRAARAYDYDSTLDLFVQTLKRVIES